MAWDFSTDPEFEEQLEWMRAFVREEIWPIEPVAADLDQTALDRIYAPLQEEVKRRGLWAAHLPPDLGGQGFGQVKLGLMHEILGSSPFAPNAFGNQAPDSGNSEVLALAGTDEQKERWLHPLLAGDLKSAFSMTEPESAGSDPTELRTHAERDGDGWVLNGHKWFSSNASIADFLIVMAVTEPDARPHQRASMFIVPVDTPGVTIVRDVATMEHPSESYGKLGNHAEILYEDVRLGPEALLGEAGAGFLIAQHRLGPGRIHHCMRWLGVSRRAFDMLCERATYRRAQGGVLGEKQTVQNWIADSAAQMQAARLMTLHAAWVMDTAGRVGRAQGDLADQVLRRGRAARRRRSRAADPRRAGLLDRHAARGDVPLRAGRALLRRPRRGPPPVGRAPDPARLRAAGRRGAQRARADAPRGVAAQVRRPARGGDRQRLSPSATAACRSACWWSRSSCSSSSGRG